MSPLVTLPNALANGTPQDGAQVRANDDAIVAAVNALDNDNVASGANIDCTKLSTTVGQQIVSGNIKDGQITAAKLASDSGTGSPTAAVGSANNIKDAIINGKKMVNTTVGSDKLEILTYSALCSTLFTQTTLSVVRPTLVAAVATVPDAAGIGTLTKATLVPICCWLELTKASPLATADSDVHVALLPVSSDTSLYFRITLDYWSSSNTVQLNLLTLKFAYLQIASQ